jgi:molybdopterin converting factor small subunit
LKIRIVFTGPSFMAGVDSGDLVTVDEGTTIRDLYLRAAHDLHEQFHQFIVSTVNGDHKDPEYVLRDGDELTLFLPVSGG